MPKRSLESDLIKDQLLARLGEVEDERASLLEALKQYECEEKPQREPASVRVKRLLMGYEVSSLMVVAHRLHLAVVLGEEQLSSIDLASKLEVKGVALLDAMLCMLSASGVFEVISRDDDEQGSIRLWTNNSLSLALQEISMQPSAFENIIKRSLLCAETAIQTGRVACEVAFGERFWQVVGRDVQVSEDIDKMMQDLFDPHMPHLLSCFDWSQFGSVVDVGGGLGHVLSALLTQFSSLKGIVFDQPTTITRAKTCMQSELKDRMEYVSGNFFNEIPTGDAVLLRWVLHNWKNDDCERILGVCLKALTKQGRLLIVEHVVPQRGCLPNAQLCAQLLGGTERTEIDWRQLLAKSGFRVLRIVPVHSETQPASSLSLIEAARFR